MKSPRICLAVGVTLTVFMLISGRAWADMSALEEAEMSGVHAQGLFVNDKISANSLTGQLGSGSSTAFTFYRMGLDARIDMNLNMSKLQLGCGGVNDTLDSAVGCDIDMDYVAFMGRNGNLPGNPVTSQFSLTRPYIELAIKGDGTANREVVGIKIGAQSVDGAVSVGRKYANTEVNQETGETCNTGAPINNSSGTATGVRGCHSGINSASGFIGAEMSADFNVKGSVCLNLVNWDDAPPCGFLVTEIDLDAYGCRGRMTGSPDGFCQANDLQDAFFIEAQGTRLSELVLSGVKLNLRDLPALLTMVEAGRAKLQASLRQLHYMVMDNTEDFFISFQREPVSYPRYSKTVPPNNLSFDACNSGVIGANGSAVNPPRCGSAYAVRANTGWWMNVPSIKLVDIEGTVNAGGLSINQTLSLLSSPGFYAQNPELELTPYDNCYGTAKFC